MKFFFTKEDSMSVSSIKQSVLKRAKIFNNGLGTYISLGT